MQGVQQLQPEGVLSWRTHGQCRVFSFLQPSWSHLPSQVSQRSSYKPAAVHAERLEIEAVDVRPLALGRSSRDEAYEKVVIKIRSEYHQRFLDALNEARKKYKKQSKVEIKIEEDIMRIYQTLIRQRADINGINYSLPGLLELESSRFCQALPFSLMQ